MFNMFQDNFHCLRTRGVEDLKELKLSLSWR